MHKFNQTFSTKISSGPLYGNKTFISGLDFNIKDLLTLSVNPHNCWPIFKWFDVFLFADTTEFDVDSQVN